MSKSLSSVLRVAGFDFPKSGYVTRRAASSFTRLHAQNHPRDSLQKNVFGRAALEEGCDNALAADRVIVIRSGANASLPSGLPP